MGLKASFLFVPAFAVLLAGCVTVSGGELASEISPEAVNDVPGAEIHGIHVWRSEGKYVVTGSLDRYGKSAMGRGHIHVEAAGPEQEMKIIGAAFPTRGIRTAKTQRRSEFGSRWRNPFRKTPPSSSNTMAGFTDNL